MECSRGSTIFDARLRTDGALLLGASVAGRVNDSICCSASSDSIDTRTRVVGKGRRCRNIWESCGQRQMRVFV
jgi:hypothetical protein